MARARKQVEEIATSHRQRGSSRRAVKEEMLVVKPPIKEKFVAERTLPPLQAKTEAQKRYLHSLRENQISVASGHAGCVDADTEFLTTTGWKKISEYQDGDLVMQISERGLVGSFVKPQRYIKEPCEQMIHISKMGIDQMLSEDHDIAYTVKIKDKLNKKNIVTYLEEAKNNRNGSTGKIPCIYNYSGKSLGLTENQIRLGVAVKADAHLSNVNTSTYHFRLKKARKIARLKSLLDSVGKVYSERYEEKTEFTVICVRCPEYNKELMEWFGCSVEDAKIIMDEYSHWDGEIKPSGNRMSRFSTTVKGDADAMQYFGNICGYRSTINRLDRRGGAHVVNGKEYTRKSVEYSVSFTKSTHVSLYAQNRGNGLFTEVNTVTTPDGFKYCFTVPQGFLVLRRNDKVFVTGNCGKSYCASFYAAQLLNQGKIEKIYITRPYAHLGTDYGATPGTDFDKLLPFCRPMLDTIQKVVGAGKYNYFLEKEMIEIAPLEKIQGRSFDEPCVILADEIQSASKPQVLSLVTRIGEGVEFLAIMGDPRQSIHKGDNALDWITKFFQRNKINGVGVTYFTEEDCVRSGIVRDILVAFEREGGFYNTLSN